MSNIPRHEEITTYVYADDIAFFAMTDNIQTLYERVQNYLNTLENWLDHNHFLLNPSKCARLVFPLQFPVHISPSYHYEDIPQVESIKYLGVIYDPFLNWRPHIEYTAGKGARAVGMLRRLSNYRTGMRRDTLIMIYRMYVRQLTRYGR